MRAKRTSQVSIYEQFAAHDIGRELEGMSALLDAQPEPLNGVAGDLGSDATTGRLGMTVESVLRYALLKQYRQLTSALRAMEAVEDVSPTENGIARLGVGSDLAQTTAWSDNWPPKGGGFTDSLSKTLKNLG
jgi:IS5 family transposase